MSDCFSASSAPEWPKKELISKWRDKAFSSLYRMQYITRFYCPPVIQQLETYSSLVSAMKQAWAWVIRLHLQPHLKATIKMRRAERRAGDLDSPLDLCGRREIILLLRLRGVCWLLRGICLTRGRCWCWFLLCRLLLLLLLWCSVLWRRRGWMMGWFTSRAFRVN